MQQAQSRYVYIVLAIIYLSHPAKVEELAIYVPTTFDEAYLTRVHMALDTWAKGSSVLFVAGGSNNSDQDLRTKIEILPCADGPVGSGALCCKVAEGMRLSLKRFPKAQWLVMASDDTYVYWEQLQSELRIFNPTHRLFVGAPSVLAACWFSPNIAACAEAHAGGGAWVMSRPLAEEFVRHIDIYLINCVQDDAHLGHFLRYVLDVHVHMLPGIKNEPRFTHVGFLTCEAPGHEDFVCGVSPCSEVLPPSVFATIDQWGSLFPFAPMDHSRLALIQSDPMVWGSLQAIPSIAEELKEGGNRLLVYLASDTQRILGPSYEGKKKLGVCILEHLHRRRSFPLATSDKFVPAQTKVSQLAALRYSEALGLRKYYQDVCAGECVVDQSHHLVESETTLEKMIVTMDVRTKYAFEPVDMCFMWRALQVSGELSRR